MKKIILLLSVVLSLQLKAGQLIIDSISVDGNITSIDCFDTSYVNSNIKLFMHQSGTWTHIDSTWLYSIKFYTKNYNCYFKTISDSGLTYTLTATSTSGPGCTTVRITGPGGLSSYQNVYHFGQTYLSIQETNLTKSVKSTTYYNLLGQSISMPVDDGIYLVRKEYTNGSVEVTKQLIQPQ